MSQLLFITCGLEDAGRSTAQYCRLQTRSSMKERNWFVGIASSSCCSSFTLQADNALTSTALLATRIEHARDFGCLQFSPRHVLRPFLVHVYPGVAVVLRYFWNDRLAWQCIIHSCQWLPVVLTWLCGQSYTCVLSSLRILSLNTFAACSQSQIQHTALADFVCSCKR